jgi:two-component system, sensor histidine kinase and response regulator
MEIMAEAKFYQELKFGKSNHGINETPTHNDMIVSRRDRIQHQPLNTGAKLMSPSEETSSMMRRKYMHWILIVGVLSCFASVFKASHAAESNLDVAQVGEEPAILAQYFDVLEDPTGELSLADVRTPSFASRFNPSKVTAESLNFGLSRSAYWLRLKIRNTSNRASDQFLEIGYPRLIRVDFFAISPGYPDRVVKTGYAEPFSSRPYQHRFFVFPMSVPAHAEQTVFLRVESRTSVEVPAKLWNRAAFHRHERVDYASQGAFFGMATAMLLFNLLLLFSLRGRGYLYYILFVGSNVVAVASSTGLGVEYLWGDVPAWSTISFAVSAHLCGIFLIAFMRLMIGTKELLPRTDRLLNATILVNTLACIATFFSYQIAMTLFLVIVTAVQILWVALLSCFKRQRGAYIFLAAFSLLLMGVIILALRIWGVLPTNFLTVNGIQFGAAIEMIVLAFALADRFHVIRQEKERAQADIVQSLRNSERLLEASVVERTAELSATVSRLQQTQNDLVNAEKLASLGSLVAGVSHELNTPIGNALTTASTMHDDAKELQKIVVEGGVRRSTLDGFLQRNVDMSSLLVRSCNRAAHLISSFKQVAVDQTSEHQREFDVSTLIEDNIASLQPSFKGAAWSIEIDAPRGIICDSYPGPLGQVLVNLIQNASIHAFDTKKNGRLSVTARCAAGAVEIVVKDDGDGMTQENLIRIFDPFFTTKLGKGGSGLGLAICRNIVTGVLGGQLTATSELGVGSQFTLRFPIVAPRTVNKALVVA